MIFTSNLVAALSLVTVAFASPILEARSCKPNFQGNPLTIYKTILGDVYEWTPVNAVGGHITLVNTPADQAFATGEFLTEFTGQPENSYHLKHVIFRFAHTSTNFSLEPPRLTADTARSLQLAGAAGDLSFAPITWSGTFVYLFRSDITAAERDFFFTERRILVSTATLAPWTAQMSGLVASFLILPQTLV
jgi:hypothetical protein